MQVMQEGRKVELPVSIGYDDGYLVVGFTLGRFVMPAWRKLRVKTLLLR